MLTGQVTIRDFVINDIAEITLLINELGYPTSAGEMEGRFQMITGHSDYKTMVAVVNDEIVGMAVLMMPTRCRTG